MTCRVRLCTELFYAITPTFFLYFLLIWLQLNWTGNSETKFYPSI